MYINDKRIDQILGWKHQLLGVYMGYRKNSEFDISPIYNYFLIFDGHCYWIASEKQVFFLETEYPEHIINRNSYD